TAEQRTVFYTALYHALLQPNTFQDRDGRYLGRDLKVHRAYGWTQHTVFSLWDTYRAAHPLYTLIEPAKDLDFVKTFLAEFRDGGRLPVWELWANETNCMIGYHAVPVIVDAWMKGLRGFDPKLALAAMKHSANEDFRGLKAYRDLGYIPADAEPESVSKTLEYAYDDWCIARFAESIGAMEDFREFSRRSQAWQHLMDKEGFFHPRANGMWVEPFNLNAVTFHFTEATPWQYAFAVPQALDAFIRRLGGPQALDAHLDGLFAASSRMEGWEEEDVTGLVGQYAHGNEPSHHIAYLYDFAGKPWKTQARVRNLMETLYADRPDGLAGNEDCGQMSAWYVFSALGFYPVCPGRPDYAIGSPLFDKAVLHLGHGRAFTILARHNGAGRPYIQAARLDGVPLTVPSLDHARIRQGGILTFDMGPEASRWGADAVPGQAESDLVPAPVAEGEALFQGRTTIALHGATTEDHLHFTLDGSEPTATSWAYGKPLELDRSATLRFRARRAGSWSPVVETRLVRLPDWPRLTLDTPIHPAFRDQGPLALIDGVRGTEDFRRGHWLGFQGRDLVATLDFGTLRTFDHLAIGFLQDPYTWTYFPLEVRFEVSEDGRTWKVAGTRVTPPELRKYGPHLHDGRTATHEYALDAELRTRFVRVTAVSPITIPKGSWREGNACFLCADELTVRAPGKNWEQDLAAFDAELPLLRAEAPPLSEGLTSREAAKRILTQLAVVDQHMRNLWRTPWDHGYGGTPDEAAFRAGFLPRSRGVDADDAAALKALLDRWGWFDRRSWGDEADNDAWLIAQHADQDVAFQKRVLGMLEPLMPHGGTEPSNYALLWDRVAVNEGRLQRFGSQGRCVGAGRWAPRPIEDPEHVDARRAAVGLGPLAEYIANFQNVCHEDEPHR
ncbi:MAG TPA: GH92 family glycosyl hydrolase, partial [Holophagaceae bacterium]|nr:GH92 family glycosyl hydrolase [Holophagaceae bacterium]